MTLRRFILLILMSFSVAACSWSNFPFLYKQDIQQGNDITDGQLAQVKIGMNRDDVNYLLGNPVLINVIDTNNIQYVYTLKKGKGKMTEKTVRLIFMQDKLKEIVR